ncbi:hypothetical protein Pla108_29660 [Botrimarina colliarenosi]|uniref:Uncharacterized protein n=1 Tax=Botrimarina colliarenosi TaxID=2528001 RepID=A0A5C6A8K9_9BACT|nr:hypothetical protein [Botrimarina colliarenosi]TWT95889.1 hypothetical protein Pla108_29660 [Botrimarina colliarenosi]
MAINVTCPSCLKRFTVADEHAGKTGPCPACKKPITIPDADQEVVIHAPKPDGPTDAKGRSVLKTSKRKDGAFDPLIATGVGIVALLALVAAFLLRGSEQADSWPVLAGGAVLLGPLVAWAGYGFLRDSELEPHRGGVLWLRSAIAGVVFAIAWYVYYHLAGQLGDSDWQTVGLQPWQMLLAAGVAVGIATFGSFASLDLEPFMAFFHCSLYFVLTVLLRVVMALPALPGLVTGDGG